MGITPSWFWACWDSSWVLDICALLVLVIWVARATQHSFSRRSRKALRVSRLRQRGTEGEGEGAKKQRGKQPRERLGRDPPSRARRAPGRRSIRQLLCDDADCAPCNAAARQAERLLYTDRAGAWVPAGSRPPPPPASGSKGRNVLDSRHGPGGKQPLSLGTMGHLEMDYCTCSSPSSLEGSESRASAGESARAASRPATEEPTLAQVHLASLWAAAYRLEFHLANALGSFNLPPCVIRSQAIYADQEHRWEMNIRLQRRRGRKSQLGERATEVTSGTVRASNLERRGHLCALQERMQARRRKLSPSLNSAASEEESRLPALDES